MHPRLLCAWARLKAIAKEACLHFELNRSGLMPLPDAVIMAMHYLPEQAHRAMSIHGWDEPQARKIFNTTRETYFANAIAIRYPLYGCVNSEGPLKRIPFKFSAGPGGSIQEDGYRLSFTSPMYGWFDDLHIEKKHLLGWIKGAREAPWLNRAPDYFYLGAFPSSWAHPVDDQYAGPPVNPDKSIMERQGQETDFDDSEVIELLTRKLDAMPPAVTDVGKPRKRWRKKLKRK